ncbi:hypothetical protein Ancab_027026, partial [Ancistrocladus abbreviatus]
SSMAGMAEDSGQLVKMPSTATQSVEGGANGEADLESNSLNQPLLRKSRTLSANSLAMVGAKVSHIESLDYE